MKSRTRRYITFATVALAVVVAGSSLLPFTRHSVSEGSVGTVAHAQTQYERVTRHYRRYGPAADRIAPSNGPETIVNRMVYSFGSDGNVASINATIEDTAGNVLQSASLAARKATYDLGGQPQHLQIHSFTSDEVKTQARGVAQRKRDGIASGQLTVLSEDQRQIVVKAKAELPYINVRDGAALPSDAYTIPYVADLGSSDAYSIVVLDRRTMATLSMSTYAVTAQGDVLVESLEVIADNTDAFEEN